MKTAFNLINQIGLVTVLFSMSLLPAITYSAEKVENNGQKLLKNCKLALEYLNNNGQTDNINAVQYCDDFLTGFREDENIKEIYMPGHYFRGYCLPDSGVSNSELANVVVSYLETNTNEQSLTANKAIRDALVNGYPCSN